jgi:hypothetical protein
VSLCGRAATPRCGRVIGPLGDSVALRLCGGVTCTQDHTITAWLGVRGHKVGLLREVPAEVAHSGLGVGLLVRLVPGGTNGGELDLRA